MLLTALAAANYYNLLNAYHIEKFGDTDGQKFVGLGAILLILVLILDILFIALAIYFAIKCYKIQKWPVWVVVLIVISFFVFPGITSLAMIIYGLVACGAPRIGAAGFRSRCY